jgi:hypothetical protein
MKIMKRNLFFMFFICVLFSTTTKSCSESIQDFGAVDFVEGDKAIVKINMASMYPDDRFMVVKFNDVRITPRIQGRQPYPGGGYNTRGPSSSEYLLVDAGTVNVKICLPKKVDDGKDSIVLYSGDINLKTEGRYTLHVTDTGANTRLIPVEEEFVLPDSAYASYRFINLMPNVESIDLYYGFFSNAAASQTPAQDSLVAANIKYGEISPSFTLHRGASKTFKVRPAGAPVTNESVLAFYGNAGSTLNQRQYICYALGYQGQTTAAMRPYVSFMLVR